MKHFYIRLHTLLLLALAISSGNVQAQAVGTWSNTGPVLFPVNVSGQVHGMGRVCQMKFHPSNPAKLYSVSASGGLFLSSDTGHTWLPAHGTELMAQSACSSVCIDYTNDQILYLSTGDPNYYNEDFGIWKSTDGGYSFNPANTGIGNRMAVEIIMDPNDHLTLVAATDDGVWRTTNGGISWAGQLTGKHFKDMKMRPLSSNVIYAVTDDSYYRSTNMGATWTLITAGISVPVSNDGLRLAVSKADTNVVYIATTDGYGQVMKSVNGGTTFSTIYTSSTQCLVCYDSTITSGSQGNYNFSITANPTDPNELLLASHCVWRSTDGGLTWSWRTRWYQEVHTDMHNILFNPYNVNIRYNANDGGVWRSHDPLATLWFPFSDGLASTEVYHAAQSPVHRQIISIGTQDNGELYYDGTWKTNRGGDWGARCNIDYLGTDAVYYDNGDRRNLSPLAGDQPYNAPFTITPQWSLEFLPSVHNTGFLATDSIWRSNDLNATLPTWDFLYTNGDDIAGLASCRADNNILYAIMKNNRLLRSDNAMAATPAFVTLTTPASTAVRASVATSKYDANIVYITCGNKIYRSANKGATWANITGTLPSLNILKVVADEYSTNERLFVSLGNYVYYKDNATPWTLTTGLPTIMGINDLMTYNDSTAGAVLRVATYGRGVWECGINNNMPPDPHFWSNRQLVCPGDTVRFHKTIYGTLSSFTWLFPGGIPATSTADSPVVVYPTAGNYNVSLIANGPGGADTSFVANYIQVFNGASASITEGFEGATFPPTAQWQLASTSGNNWEQTAACGGYGTSAHAMLFNNFDNDGQGKKDRILLPKTDLTFATVSYLKFDVAYAFYPSYMDTLMVEVSDDCGKTYNTVYLKSSTTLATAPDATAAFTPTATQWRTDSISLSSYLGGSVLVSFTSKGHYGQKLYIDNINLYTNGPPTGIAPPHPANGLQVYPNPAKDLITVKGNCAGKTADLFIYNSIGAAVQHTAAPIINGRIDQQIKINASAGVYIVKLVTDKGETLQARLVVE